MSDTPTERPLRLIVEGISNRLHPEMALPPPSQLTAALTAEQSLGYRVVAEMDQYLLDRGIDMKAWLESQLGLSATHPWRRIPSYHVLELVSSRPASSVILDIYRRFGDPNNVGEFVERIEIERTLQLLPAYKGHSKIGRNFKLAGNHQSYRQQLGVGNAGSATGLNAIVAVLDSGADPTQISTTLAGWHDLTANKVNAAEDGLGHGTAMTMIIENIAPGAEIHALRVTDSGEVLLWDLMAGLKIAAFQIGAHFINLSLGLDDLAFQCDNCGGAKGNRSEVFESFFERIEAGSGLQGAPDPLFLAATGNGASTAFDWPAAFDRANLIAIGAVTSQKRRSSFSNTGSGKSLYYLCPGGEIEDVNGIVNVKEWVGEGEVDENNQTQTTYCVGTSPATAYATGFLALLRDYRENGGQSFDRKGLLDRISNLAQADVVKDDGSKDDGHLRLEFAP
jgi:hypothetical protein